MIEQKETILIERLKKAIQANHPTTGEYAWHHQRAALPATVEEIAQAETQLGFELPSLLRRLYLEVGNGGFGPGYGLYALNANDLSEDSLVTCYLGMRLMSQKDLGEHWADKEVKPSLWPECVLMLCDWGCNIYSCLDCASPELSVYRMDSNKNFMVEWAMEAPSLQQWLEAWIEGKPLSALDWDRASKVLVARLGKG